MKNEKIKAIALCGTISALSVAILFVGAVFQTLDLSTAALAGFAVLVAKIETGGKYCIGVYAVTAVLSLLIVPNKSAPLLYVAFAGLYPLLKWEIEKIRIKPLAYVIKGVVFSILFFGATMAASYLLSVEDMFFKMRILNYAFCVALFVMYDLALTLMLKRYRNVFRRRKK